MENNARYEDIFSVLNACHSISEALGTKFSEELYKGYFKIKEERGPALSPEDKLFLFEIADYYMQQLAKEAEEKGENKRKSKSMPLCDDECILSAVKGIYGDNSTESAVYALKIAGTPIPKIATTLDIPTKSVSEIIAMISRDILEMGDSDIYIELYKRHPDKKAFITRTVNSLRRNEIYSMADLRECGLSGLKRCRDIGNAGVRMLVEII